MGGRGWGKKDEEEGSKARLVGEKKWGCSSGGCENGDGAVGWRRGDEP